MNEVSKLVVGKVGGYNGSLGHIVADIPAPDAEPVAWSLCRMVVNVYSDLPYDPDQIARDRRASTPRQWVGHTHRICAECRRTAQIRFKNRAPRRSPRQGALALRDVIASLGLDVAAVATRHAPEDPWVVVVSDMLSHGHVVVASAHEARERLMWALTRLIERIQQEQPSWSLAEVAAATHELVGELWSPAEVAAATMNASRLLTTTPGSDMVQS